MKNSILISFFLCLIVNISKGQSCEEKNSYYQYAIQRSFSNTEVIPLQAGGTLTFGTKDNGNGFTSEIILFRTDPIGGVNWSRVFTLPQNLEVSNCEITENVTDGSLILNGLVKDKSLNFATGDLITSIRADGSVNWSQLVTPLIPGTAAGETIHPSRLCTDNKGNIFIVSTSGGIYSDRNQVTFLSKLSSNGTLLWNKAFVPATRSNTYGDFLPKFVGIFWDRDTLTLLSSNGNQSAYFAAKTKATDGTLIATTSYRPTNYAVFPNADYAKRLHNGNFIFNGPNYSGNGDISGIDFSTVILNESFAPVTAFHVKTFAVYYANGWGGVAKNMVVTGNDELVYGVARTGEKKIYVGVIDNNGNIITQRFLDYSSLPTRNFFQPPLSHADASNTFLFGNGSTPMYPNTIDLFSISEKIISTNGCLSMSDTNFMSKIPFRLEKTDMRWDYSLKNVLNVIPIAITTNNFSVSQVNACIQKSTCSSITLPDSLEICLLNSATVLRAARNSNCFQRISWQASAVSPGSLEAITSITDTSVSLTFSKPWQGYVYASYEGNCNIIDSTWVNVAVGQDFPMLANDTSICKNTNLNVAKPADATRLVWNTGDTTSSLLIMHSGQFSIKAYKVDGCFYKDSVRVLSVLQNPVLALKKPIELCTGMTKTVIAGPETYNYAWQDGSTENQFKVSLPGQYWVKATNQHGCSKVDTFVISNYKDPPANFLWADTVICENQKIILAPLASSFTKLLWFDGSSGNFLNITRPGNYWLQLQDSTGCVGKDSVNIQFKRCVAFLKFPNAITKNYNGLNEVFRPKTNQVFRNYRLTIYNRWGQTLFQSTTAEKGWDGTFRSVYQKNSLCIWVCEYQFVNGKAAIEKGTILPL